MSAADIVAAAREFADGLDVSLTEAGNARIHITRLADTIEQLITDHLEPVTPRENWERGFGPARINALRTHCIRGHEFTPENTYYPKRGGRVCRACNSRAVTCPQCGNQVSRQNLAAHTRRNHGKERS